MCTSTYDSALTALFARLLTRIPCFTRLPQRYNFWGVRNGTVSTALRAKYDSAVSALRTAGFSIIAKEWPNVDSKWFKRSVNTVIDTMFGSREINNLPYDGVGAAHLHSFTGQVRVACICFRPHSHAHFCVTLDLYAAGYFVHMLVPSGMRPLLLIFAKQTNKRTQ